MAIFMGIDPGSRRTGWGVVSIEQSLIRPLGFGVIDVDREPLFARRLAQISENLRFVIADYKPQVVVVERVFLGRSADSAFKLGHARGLALAAAGEAALPVAEYATRHVKKVLTGTGAASKEQVQFMIQKLLGIRTDQLDATDALALAVCYAREHEVELSMQNHQGRLNRQKEKSL